MEVTVLAVQKWTIKNETENLQGITIHFFDIADNETSPDCIGVLPAKITADQKLFDKFTTLPAKYNFNIRLKRGAAGKSKPVLLDVTKVEK